MSHIRLIRYIITNIDTSSSSDCVTFDLCSLFLNSFDSLDQLSVAILAAFVNVLDILAFSVYVQPVRQKGRNQSHVTHFVFILFFCFLLFSS